MTAKKPVSWFLTESGRNFSFFAVTGTGIAFATGLFVPHTFGISYYKDFVHFYVNSKPADLPQELHNRFNKCLEILNIADAHKKLLSPFSASGFDLFNAGTTKSKYGAVVGLPVHFTFKSIEDVKKEADRIMVNQRKIDWNSEVGQNLANSLVLSEKVQQFAICREILSTHNSKVLIQATYPFLSVLTVYTVSQTLNHRLNLYAAPTAMRGIFYSLTGLFGLGLYFFLKDYTEVYFETKIDKALAELGPEFVESGVEFYDKMLQRNKALRELMKEDGSNSYTVIGNENFGVRQPRIALTHRKAFFENLLKETKNDLKE